MEEKMWTTEMMMELIFNYGAKSSWQIRGKKPREYEYAKIVSLLKAFDLYVEDKQTVFDKHCGDLVEKDDFNIGDFYRGNFIKKRSEEEIAELLRQLKEDRIIRQDFRFPPEDDCSYLSRIFSYLVEYRFTLQQSMNVLSFEHVTETFILYQSLRQIEQEVEKIDSVLLKIIGDKEPVSEEVLIQKYGFLETGLLTGSKSLAEIIAAL